MLVELVRFNMLDKINKEVMNCQETVFDQFDLDIDERHVGHALREDLSRLVNQFGRINQLASNALLLFKQAEIKRDEVESLAWVSVPKDVKVTMQRKLLKTQKVEYNGESTTLNEAEKELSVYEYIYNRGKDKQKEIATMISVGQSLLSWDRNESSKYGVE